MTLNDNDILLFNEETAAATSEGGASFESTPASASSRIIIDNITEQQALQINGPIGEQGWREVSYLRIETNRASGRSIQVNHGMSTGMFMQMLEARSR